MSDDIVWAVMLAAALVDLASAVTVWAMLMIAVLFDLLRALARHHGWL